MDIVYSFIDVLHLDWLSYSFMKNALIGLLLAAPLFGLMGTMVVNGSMAFFSDSIGHGAFTGIAIGTILGLGQPLAASIIFSVIYALFIITVKNKSKTSVDTVIGVFSSTAVALGLVLLSVGGTVASYSSYLIGDILSITPEEIVLLLVVLAVFLVVWTFIMNSMVLVNLSRVLAKSKGIKPDMIEMIFTVLLAIVVTVSIKWVGLLLVNSLLILPAASARNIASNMTTYNAYAVAISLFNSMTGLVVSYYLGLSTGGTIVLVSALVFFLSMLAGSLSIKKGRSSGN